ncbi:MAG: hypothetical protein V4493_01115 [Pseudomonadota bacterium]
MLNQREIKEALYKDAVWWVTGAGSAYGHDSEDVAEVRKEWGCYDAVWLPNLEQNCLFNLFIIEALNDETN